jgi:predicted naringenin-chalcone synthase
MSWRIGNNGFLMTLSPQVPKLIRQHLAGWVDEWLGGYGMDRSRIKSWAIHPGGPRLLSSARESLGISKEETQVSEEILAGYGNMSSATMIFILREMVSRNYPLPCVSLGFGPGLTMEGALFV